MMKKTNTTIIPIQMWMRAGTRLLAHVLVNKYADHLPLCRQNGIFERDGIDIDRYTLADWVVKSTALLEPLVDAIGRHVLASQARARDSRLFRFMRRVPPL